MNAPEISVVMSVFNGASSVEETVKSILSQADVELEFIIVNDGSSDECLSILRSIEKKDSRIVLIDQANQGLTSALINACNHARGQFIARQDNGDVSLAHRLKNQFEYLRDNASVSILSCSTRFVAPNGEELYCVAQSALDARNGLKQLTVNRLKGPPHHGSVMFRRESYKQVGGYRGEFLVAQDIDLWSRLVEIGEHHSLQEILYQAVLEKNSISMLKRDIQLQATQAIIDCAQARKHTGNDGAVLASYASSVNKSEVILPSSQTDSAYYYFLASSLSTSNIKASSRYLRLAIQRNPLHWKARVKLMINYAKNLANGILKR